MNSPGIHRVTVARDRFELREQNCAIDNRAGGEAAKRLGQRGFELLLGVEGKMRLAGCGTMKRQGNSDRRRDTHGAIFGLGRFQRHDAVAPDDRDVSALAAFAGDIGQDGARLPHQTHMMDVTASEMQTLDAEAIILGGFVLFDIAARFERREDSKDVVLMQLEPLGKFSYSQFIDIAEELFEHIERVGDGLDEVVGFVASDHFFQRTSSPTW